MEEDLLRLLRDRRISADAIQLLENQKLDLEAMSKASVDILAPYFPTLGDCLAVKNFCIQKIEGIKRKQGIVDLIKNKMTKKQKRRSSSSSDEKRSLSVPVSTKNLKDTKQVWFGWLCSLNGDRHKQVRLKQGGGTRKLEINKNARYEELLIASKNIFFKDGVSSKGRVEDFSFSLWDFQQNPVGDFTVEEMFKITGLTRLRFYLVSTENICTNSNSQSSIIDCDSTPVGSTTQLTLPFNNHETSYVSHYSESEESLPGFPLTHTLPDLSFAEHEALPVLSFAEHEAEPQGFTNHNLAVSEEFSILVNSVLDNNTQMFANGVQNESPSEIGPSPKSVKEALETIQSQISSDRINKFNVYREDIFGCCIRAMRRKSFQPLNKISVKFSDMEGNSEGAVDEGGPAREMFRLLMHWIKESPMFCGSTHKHISLSGTAFEEGHYYEAGRLIALSLIHGGPAPHFFSNTLYDCLTTAAPNPTLDDVVEEIKMQLTRLTAANELQDIQNVLLDSDIFSIAGYTYIKNKEDKDNILLNTLKFYAVTRIREPLNQFIEGLKICGLLEAIRKCPEMFKPLFCVKKMQLTSTEFETIFEITYSATGSNSRATENRVISYFRDYILDCEASGEMSDNTDTVTLIDILIFATGADSVPPLGFPLKPQITFLHGEETKFPLANTCSLHLKLPTIHTNYNDFQNDMNFGIGNSKTFGFA